MLSNYYRIALRNIFRSKLFSALHVMGISIGMAAALLVLYYVIFETTFDTFHRNVDTIYRVESTSYRDGVFEGSTALTPPAVGKTLLDNFPEVRNYTRIAANPGKTIITFGDKILREPKAYLADPAIFEIFTLEMIMGNPGNQLENPRDLAVSESLAEKIFGTNWKSTTTLPITVSLNSQGLTGVFSITGIFQNFPANSHFNPELLAPQQYIRELVGDLAGDDNWNFNFFYTYIQIAPSTLPQSIQAKFNTWVSDRRKDALGAQNEQSIFQFRSLADIHLKSNVQFELERNGDSSMVYGLGLLGLVILLVAWINYVNLSTARNIRRAKEVGIRKVLGAAKGQLVTQFMFEAIVINTIGFLLALGIVEFSKPLFSEITGIPVAYMRVAYLVANVPLTLDLILIFLSGVLLAGFYPSFILSRFHPVRALKGSMPKSGGITLRQALVIAQFSISWLTLTATLLVFRQVNFMRSADLGIEIGNTLIVEAPENLEAVAADVEGAGNGFKHAMNGLSFVKGFSMSSAVPGEEITLRSYHLASEKTAAVIHCGMIGIDADFIQNYDLTLLAGTNFSSLTRDASQVILNEVAVAQLGFTGAKDAIGSKLVHQQKGLSEEFIITGVVKNYHHRSLRTAYEPILFRNGRGQQYYSIQLTGQGWKQIRDNIELVAKQFNTSFPGNPFLYYFLDQQFETQYQAEMKFGKAFFIFSILAVIVATLGLLGLSTLMINLRTPEIGIRKIFGASRQIITLLLVKDYVKLYGIAVMLAAPIAWFAAMKWLARYAFSIEPGFVLLALPMVGLLLIIFFTIGFQSFMAASRNPIHALKEE